jgi:hypothetical protein
MYPLPLTCGYGRCRVNAVVGIGHLNLLRRWSALSQRPESATWTLRRQWSSASASRSHVSQHCSGWGGVVVSGLDVH